MASATAARLGLKYGILGSFERMGRITPDESELRRA
jgi:hypothetical protein